MEQQQNDFKRYGGKGRPRIFTGLALIIAGVLLFAYLMGAPVPGWVFTWPVLLITIGVITGLKSNFHNPGAFIMIVIGLVFLLDRLNPEFNLHKYIAPVILVAVGLIYVLRPRNSWTHFSEKKWRENWRQDNEVSAYPPIVSSTPTDANKQSVDPPEHIEINAVFGGVKKLILSKNFMGGEITSFMGGAEINFLKADIQQPIVLEVNNVFGGTKLIVPSNWDVKNEVTAVFGGIEDKRNINSAMPDPSKTMVLKGTCVFGGIEVNNY